MVNGKLVSLTAENKKIKARLGEIKNGQFVKAENIRSGSRLETKYSLLFTALETLSEKNIEEISLNTDNEETPAESSSAKEDSKRNKRAKTRSNDKVQVYGMHPEHLGSCDPDSVKNFFYALSIEKEPYCLAVGKETVEEIDRHIIEPSYRRRNIGTGMLITGLALATLGAEIMYKFGTDYFTSQASIEEVTKLKEQIQELQIKNRGLEDKLGLITKVEAREKICVGPECLKAVAQFNQEGEFEWKISGNYSNEPITPETSFLENVDTVLIQKYGDFTTLDMDSLIQGVPNSEQVQVQCTGENKFSIIYDQTIVLDSQGNCAKSQNPSKTVYEFENGILKGSNPQVSADDWVTRIYNSSQELGQCYIDHAKPTMDAVLFSLGSNTDLSGDSRTKIKELRSKN